MWSTWKSFIYNWKEVIDISSVFTWNLAYLRYLFLRHTQQLQYFYAISQNNTTLDPFMIYSLIWLDLFHVYLDPFDVYVLVSISIGLNIVK